MRRSSSYSSGATARLSKRASTKYGRVSVTATPVATTAAMGITLSSPHRAPLRSLSRARPRMSQPAPARCASATTVHAAARFTGTYAASGTSLTIT
jgi:hypothetical protein